MKTKEELDALKKELADFCKKLAELTEDERKEIGICFRDPNELTEDELAQVGGAYNPIVAAISSTIAPLAIIPTIPWSF